MHFTINTYFDSRQADKKKKEGNRLYNNKNFRGALQRYSEAIGNDYIKTSLGSTSICSTEIQYAYVPHLFVLQTYVQSVQPCTTTVQLAT